MPDNKTLILDYLRTLSGQPKTPELVRQFVSDESLIQHIAEIEEAFPAYELIVEDLIAEGDKVVGRCQFRGVHQHSYAGMQATGKAVAFSVIIIYRIAGGKIAEHWMQLDAMGLMEQLQQGA